MHGAIGVAAGHAIHRLLDRVQRHVELLALHAIGDEHLHAHHAVGRLEPYMAARRDATLGGQRR